jgi:GT2 family glycosyltransferase
VSSAAAETRVSIVVLTHNRADELERTLQHLLRLPERPPIVVADNASHDGSLERVARCFPQVECVRCGANRGAAGRNDGVARVRTPYVAFCDDDTWWAAGALSRAADLLDAQPRLAAVAARVLVGADERLDPTCEAMATSPLEARGLPGPALIGFMAGAVVMRTQAFREAGGYEPRLFIGAEESLLGLDLAARGWQMMYAADVVAHHHPSSRRSSRQRQALLLGNRIRIAWLRLSAPAAWQESVAALREARALSLTPPVLRRLLRGLPWMLARRRVVPRPVERMYRTVHASPPQPSPRGPSGAKPAGTRAP